MDMKFFDANMYVGRPNKKIFGAVASCEDLLKEMERQNIEKAIIWHIAQYDLSPVEGNRLLSETVRNDKRLYGCWSILPPQTEEVIDDSFFCRMKEERIFALRAFPDFHRYILDETVFGGFFEELSERKIPLLLSLEKGSSWQWQGVYNLMKSFPSLVCIFCDIGIWGVDRQTWPLLEKYPNVYLETSLLSLGYRQLEATVKKFGAERVVFGSGFPERYIEGAVCEILHADISASDREKIACLNLERIISEIKL